MQPEVGLFIVDLQEGFCPDMIIDIHMDRAGGRHLYIAFSEKGTQMLYQVGHETIDAENSHARQG